MSGRLLVVGASSGIGRAVAVRAAGSGWRVAATARRADLLDALAAEHPGITAIPGDVRDPESCRSMVDAALAALGGLDALVYCAGVVPLKPLAEAGPGVWRDVMETNVVGASLVTAAVVEHVRHAVYLSSDSVGRPLPGLVPYAASKAALEETVRGWQAEHPGVRFTTLVVGPTLTGMASEWDPADLAAALDRWAREGYAQGRPDPQPPEAVADQVLAALQEALRSPS